MTVLVDSDVIIEVLRRRDETILDRWFELTASDAEVCCSPVSLAEIWQGARPPEQPAIAMLFEALTCVVIDGDTGRAAGALLQRYSKSHGVDLGDALIAATAIRSDALLWTRNRKHYPMPELSFY